MFICEEILFSLWENASEVDAAVQSDTLSCTYIMSLHFCAKWFISCAAKQAALKSCLLLVVRSVVRTGTSLLPPDGTDGVRFGLQGHAKFGSDGGNGSWRELEMKPL